MCIILQLVLAIGLVAGLMSRQKKLKFTGFFFLGLLDRGNIRNPYFDIYNSHMLPHFYTAVEILVLKLKINSVKSSLNFHHHQKSTNDSRLGYNSCTSRKESKIAQWSKNKNRKYLFFDFLNNYYGVFSGTSFLPPKPFVWPIFMNFESPGCTCWKLQ